MKIVPKAKRKTLPVAWNAQVGEWTGDTDAQAKGAMKQAEGKVQNAWGKAQRYGEEKRRR